MDVVARGKKRPRLLLVVSVLFVVTLLRIRGHATFESGADFANLVRQVPQSLVTTLGSGDSAMLATWYVDSFTKDTLGGYDYGIPIVNYSLTGWLPAKYFPWKYFLLRPLLERQQAYIPLELQNFLYGGKATLIGSFYGEGGLIGVLLLSALTGFLMRKLDGMMAAEAPPPVLATGIMWMGLLWMIWGSDDFWGIGNFGVIAAPAIGLWLLLPKNPPTGRARKSLMPGSGSRRRVPPRGTPASSEGLIDASCDILVRDSSLSFGAHPRVVPAGRSTRAHDPCFCAADRQTLSFRWRDTTDCSVAGSKSYRMISGQPGPIPGHLSARSSPIWTSAPRMPWPFRDTAAWSHSPLCVGAAATAAGLS